jgi:hypothetical protein
MMGWIAAGYKNWSIDVLTPVSALIHTVAFVVSSGLSAGVAAGLSSDFLGELIMDVESARMCGNRQRQ